MMFRVVSIDEFNLMSCTMYPIKHESPQEKIKYIYHFIN